MPLAKGDTLIAFDVGLKRTGVAIGRQGSQTAQMGGSLAVNNGRHAWREVEQLLENWQPRQAVIGNPGTEDPHLNKAIRRLAHFLTERKIKVVRIDETLTSASANAELEGHQLSTKQKTEMRDQIAACLILETYLSSQSSSTE